MAMKYVGVGEKVKSSRKKARSQRTQPRRAPEYEPSRGWPNMGTLSTNKSSANDLFGLNLGLIGHSDSVANPESSVTSPVPGFTSPVFTAPPRADRYAELSEILSEVDSTNNSPPALPPRGGSSRGSTPTPTIAIPRPPSRKAFECPSIRGRQSPALSLGLSRAESISSVEFRTAPMQYPATSRGPSPLTLGHSDTIPLAVAFQEMCHAYFRGTDESRCQVKVTGEMMVSFPSGIVGVLTSNPSPAPLTFRVSNLSRVENLLPNRQLIAEDAFSSNFESAVYNFNMGALTSLLRKQAEMNPSAAYFNVDLIKYQVSVGNGAVNAPLQLVAYWNCHDEHTELRVDYKYNQSAMPTGCPLLNVAVTVPVDGVVTHMHSKPSGQWLCEQQRAVWKLTEVSQHGANGGTGSLRAKFEVSAGPSTPATVSAQFNCEGTTVSGAEFGLVGSGYRVSLAKRRFISGKYICDADAVLRLRYGTLPS